MISYSLSMSHPDTFDLILEFCATEISWISSSATLSDISFVFSRILISI